MFNATSIILDSFLNAPAFYPLFVSVSLRQLLPVILIGLNQLKK